MHLIPKFHFRFSLLSLLIMGSSAVYATNLDGFAPVSGFARSFITGTEIANATITVLETGYKLTTDSHGHYGPFYYPIGKPLTLSLTKWDYATTQSGTVIVPRSGLTDPHNNITFQVPSLETYYLLATIIGANFDKNCCHVVTTILANGKTMDDDEQGEVDAHITLSPQVDDAIPFYFDIFQSGPLKGKTNPFTKGLKATTKDGGVGFYNLPARDEPYTISAEKDGVSFTTAQFTCTKDTFINISPPSGPMALK